MIGLGSHSVVMLNMFVSITVFITLNWSFGGRTNLLVIKNDWLHNFIYVMKIVKPDLKYG